MSENIKTPEQQELKPPIDFKQIFEAKLESIEPLSEEDSAWESQDIQKVGIESVVKKAPCIVFFPEMNLEAGFDIWLENAEDCDRIYPHGDVTRKFREFQKQQGVKIANNGSSAYIFQDKEGKKYLIFLDLVATFRKSDIQDPESAKRWDELAKRYNLEKMLGSFKHITREVSEDPETGSFSISSNYGRRFENIMDKDTITNIRENSYLRSFAEKYQMTNNQFMRFRIRAIAGRNAALTNNEAGGKGVSYLMDLDNLAKEVLAQDKEEGQLENLK